MGKAADKVAFERQRHDDIKRRAKREPLAAIAESYGLSLGRVQRIVRIGE